MLLLRQHGVVGSLLGEQPHQQLVRGEVAGVLELLALETLSPHVEEQGAGLVGGPGRELVVVHAATLPSEVSR